MIFNRHTDRLIAYGVVGVLLLAIAFIVIAGYGLQKRQMDLAGSSLDRTQQMLRLRLDAMFQELNEDLREESAVLEEKSFTDLWALEDRWRPLVNSHWSILAIRLADEHGDLISYQRNGGTNLLIVSSSYAPGRAPLLIDPQVRDTIPLDTARFLDEITDPRQQIWFGKALENTRDEPAWNIRYENDTTIPILQVSKLFRPRQEGASFKIIQMDVDLSRSYWMDTHTSPLNQYGVMLLDGTGHLLQIPHQRTQGTIPQAVEKAADQWLKDRNARPYSIDHDGRTYRALIAPYSLNGLTLYSGVLLDAGLIEIWTKPEKIGLVVMGILIVLLSTLLAWMALRKRKENAKLQRQARRSRTQERKLAKAIGEREVLNREVHHRVKNNLQVVSSLLNLQATRLDEGPVREEFIRGKKRIDMIALVHHKLYGLQDLRNVNIGTFFNALIAGLATMHQPRSRTISFEVDANDLLTDQDTAIELGIILCELVSNCFQHAFPYATGGHVDIQVRSVENDLYRLIVRDNGKGLNSGYADGPGKLGLEIVDALAGQLDGEFHMTENNGVVFEVLFRMSRQRYADPLEA